MREYYYDDDWNLLPYRDDDYDDSDRYYAEIAELESLATLRMNVNTYTDYFPDQQTLTTEN